jgi:mRNA interferase MazF
VFLVRLDPAEGREMRKTRPCLFISPDEMNRHIDTVIVAPMTTKGRPYPTRIPVHFKGANPGRLRWIRSAVDKNRFVKRLGRIQETTRVHVLALLAELFAP